MADNKTAKTETQTAAQAPAKTTGFDPSKVEVVKNVTLPLLKKQDDVPVYIKVTGPIFTGKQVKGTGENAKMEPARLANIVNLETGEEMQIICNKVMESTLTEEYPDDGYVGKAFRIVQMAVEGKRYKNYSIAEIKA